MEKLLLAPTASSWSKRMQISKIIIKSAEQNVLNMHFSRNKGSIYENPYLDQMEIAKGIILFVRKLTNKLL